MTKHVMITGCSRGLGLAMARSFAARGWRVYGCGTKQDGVERLAAKLGKQGDLEMLQCTFGKSSSDFQRPATWAENAVPLLEKLGPRDNGMALTASQG